MASRSESSSDLNHNFRYIGLLGGSFKAYNIFYLIIGGDL